MLDPSILVNATTPIVTPVIADVSDADATMPNPPSVAATTDDANQEGVIAQRESQCESQRQAQRQASILAATVQIQAELNACRDFDQVAHHAVHRIAQTLFGYRIQIGWRKSLNTPCELIADSQPSQPLPKPWLAAAEEIAHRGEATIYPPISHADRHALMAVNRLAKSMSISAMAGVPLVDSQGNNHGVLLSLKNPTNEELGGEEFGGEEAIQSRLPTEASTANESSTPTGTPDSVAIQSHDQTPIDALAQLQSIANGLANQLAMFQSIRPSRLVRVAGSVSSFLGSRRLTLSIVIGAAVAAISMLPMRYQVAAVCELQPVERRTIASPIDGPLQSVRVRPGDIVESGETLATIDPREIDFQLASLDAEVRRAIQEKKGMIATHDFGGSEIATLEAKRLRADQELLQHQRDNLEIRSPITGMVITGDLQRSVGSPLSKGDPLFEVAPLEAMIVELAIGESDFNHVRPGMSVSIRLAAMTSQSMVATIDRIHPHAELRDGENVFIADASIDNSQGTLRPGMRGHARIISDRHPLGWNLFHHAYDAACRRLGW